LVAPIAKTIAWNAITQIDSVTNANAKTSVVMIAENRGPRASISIAFTEVTELIFSSFCRRMNNCF
jgi:hypothetical protein